MRYLIVNADDLGLSIEINDGIFEAFQRGIVTDASLLVYSPHADRAAQIARAIGLPVGLHIDLVSLFVQDSSPLFGPQGPFVHLLFQREYEHRFDYQFTCDQLVSVRNELRIQIRDFKTLVGRLPTHLDYHYGLHYLPDVMAIYLTVAEEFNLPVRWGCQYAGNNPYPLAPHHLCDRFRGIEYGAPDLLLEQLAAPWKGVMEMICHPGYHTPTGLLDPYNLERERELQTLTDPRIKNALQDWEIQLVNFEWLKRTLLDPQNPMKVRDGCFEEGKNGHKT